jgi:hypothetical protein
LSGSASETEPVRIPLEALQRAVAIYLAHAYPAGLIPETVRGRVDWPADADTEKLLSRPPFERANRPGEGIPAIFALRLGNHRYPHMKLQIQSWSTPEGYLLSVNTHDQALALNVTGSDAAAYNALQAENQRLKELIESAWQENGLPTFLSFLRAYIQNHSAADAELS